MWLLLLAHGVGMGCGGTVVEPPVEPPASVSGSMGAGGGMSVADMLKLLEMDEKDRRKARLRREDELMVWAAVEFVVAEDE